MRLSQIERLILAGLGIPHELVKRLFRSKYVTTRDFIYTCPETSRQLVTPAGFQFDGFTWAPNLRNADGQRSSGAPAHDYAWSRGTWSRGKPHVMTFDECNELFRRILIQENHPRVLVEAYYRCVCMDWLRRRWTRQHGHE